MKQRTEVEETPVTSAEFRGLARHGFNHLRDWLTTPEMPSEFTRNKVKGMQVALNEAHKIDRSDATKARLLLDAAQILGIPKEEQRPIWDLIATNRMHLEASHSDGDVAPSDDTSHETDQGRKPVARGESAPAETDRSQTGT